MKEKQNFNIENKYKIDSKNIYYDRNIKKLYSNEETIIEDNENNILYFKRKVLNLIL